MSAPATAPNPPPARRGPCTPPALAELVRDLYLEERTGTLTLSRSGAEKRVYLDRGMVLAVGSSLEDERLTVHMVQRGLITEEQALVLKGLDDRQAAEALLSRGDVTLDQLTTAIRHLAQQALTAVFRWENLEYRFDEGPLPAWPTQTNSIVSFELIIRALGSMGGFEPVRDAMMRQERTLCLSEQMYLPFEQLGLSSIEGYLVSRIDGRTRARDILAQVPPSEEESASRFLFGLLILALVQFNPPIGSGLLTCGDLLRGDEEKRRREEREEQDIREMYKLSGEVEPAVLLGVNKDSHEDQVREAYQAHKERYDAGRFLRTVSTRLREELQIIEARLLEAYLALRGKALEVRRQDRPGDQVLSLDLEALSIRKELTKTERQSVEEEKVRLAEQFITRAREYSRMGDSFNCIRYCEFANSHNPNDASTWSLLGQALARNPDYRWQKRAEAALKRANELEPFNPAHLVQLGEFCRAHGLKAKAKKHFQKALEIVPSHPEATSALQEISETED